MATLALAAYTAEMSIAAQTAALVVGTIADQRLNALIFKGDDPEPPRLNDLGVGSSSPGAPIAKVFGRNPGRTPGIVIWRGAPLYKNQSTGGKGGTSVNTIVKQDLAVLISFNGKNARALQDITRIWCNGQLAYKKNRQVDETSTSLGTVIRTDPDPITGLYTLGIIETDADMSELTAENQSEVTVTGAGVDSKDYVVWNVNQMSTPGQWKLYVRTADGSQITGGIYGSGVRFQQNLPDWQAGTLDDANFHDGSQTTADGYISGAEGTDEAPAWEGYAYIVLRQFNLTRYGNRPPNFEFEIEPPGGLDTPSETITELLKDGGLDTAEIDVSEVNDSELQQFEFYAVRGAQSTAAALQPVLLNGWLYAWEEAGKVHVARRWRVPQLNVDSGDLAAHVQGGQFPAEVEIDEPSEVEIATRGEIDFQDYDADGLDGHAFYESAAAMAQGIDRTVSLRLPLTTTADKARAIIKRAVLQGIYDRRRVNFTLPWSVGRVTPATRVYFQSASGINFKVLVTRVNKGRGGVYEVEGIHAPSLDMDFELAAEPS